MDDLERLRDAFGRVESFFHGDTASAMPRSEILESIFRLNTEIGRLASSRPAQSPGLRALQVQVNAIVVAVKRDDRPAALGHLSAARDLLLIMRAPD